jgi:hypothetical protein
LQQHAVALIEKEAQSADLEMTLRKLDDTDHQEGRLLVRRSILCEQPLLVGASWAAGWFQTMLSEGRRVSGGWPGTVPEARFRAKQHCDHELSIRGLPLLSQEELSIATAATYERAKHDWLQIARSDRLPPSR